MSPGPFLARLLVGSLLSVSLTPAIAQNAPALPPSRTLPPEDGEQRLRSFLVGKGGLTSLEVGRRALAVSPDVIARREGALAAKAQEDQATAQFWPRLSGSARYTRLSHVDPVFLPGGVRPQNPALQSVQQPTPLAPGEALEILPSFPFPVFENNYSVVATLSVPVSDYLLRLSRATRAAERTTRAAQKDEEAARRNVVADARIAYYDWIRARGQVLVTQDRLQAMTGYVADTRRMFEAGFTSKADVLRAESQQKGIQLALTRFQHLAALAEERLRVFMHDDGSRRYEIGENLIETLPAVAELNDRNALVGEALSRRPEVAVLAETEAALKDLAWLAKTSYVPRVDLVGNATYANPNQRIFPPRQKWDPTWDASVVLSWTPSDIIGASATAREQMARARQTAAQRQSLVDGLRLEVHQAVSGLTEADANIETTTQGLNASQESYRTRRELFLVGKSTFVEVTDAEADLTRARLEVVNAHIEARIARVRLAHALGRDLLK
jgi:outer membrane protein TolC